jgi:purine-binding chemotaxis protein CheW
MQTMEGVDFTSRLLATFELRGGGYALDAREVLEVIRTCDCTPVAHAHPAVLGVMNLRGRIVTLLDLGMLLGLQPHAWNSQDLVVLVERDGEWFGLVIDAIGEVRPVTADSLLAVPEHITPPLRAHCRGILRAAGRAWMELQADSLLDAELSLSLLERKIN